MREHPAAQITSPFDSFPTPYPNGPLCSLENPTINSSPFICTTTLPGPTQKAFLLGNVPASTSVYLMICNSYIINQSTSIYLCQSFFFLKYTVRSTTLPTENTLMIKVFLKLPEKCSFFGPIKENKKPPTCIFLQIFV